MAKLTYAQREKLKRKATKNFALPAKKEGGDDRYPLVNAQGKPSRSHAANAKARATQMYNKGKLSAAQRAIINKKANAVLKKTEPKNKTTPKRKKK